MPRITLQDVLLSDLPEAIGYCESDVTRVAKAVNQAQQRLIDTGGETGFLGGWEKTVFNVNLTDPYITLPPAISRIINADLCRSPVNVRNQWFQFLTGSGGLVSPDCENGRKSCNPSQLTDRGFYPTAYDIPDDNSYLRLYYTDARDVGARMFFADAKDQNGNGIYTDGNGFYLTYATPFATTSFIVTSFSGVQKSRTWGDIILQAVDATTGEETFLARFTPDELNPSYRRYLVTGLPWSCANSEDCTAQVTVMAKLAFIPAVRATDFLIIQSIPALRSMCQCQRYERMDNLNAAAMAQKCEADAIRILNKQLGGIEGKQNPAITVTPFGSATLARSGVGYVI